MYIVPYSRGKWFQNIWKKISKVGEGEWKEKGKSGGTKGREKGKEKRKEKEKVNNKEKRQAGRKREGILQESEKGEN